MDEKTTAVQQKKSGGFLNAKTMLIASIACLAIAFFCQLIPALLYALQNADSPEYITQIFTSTLSGSINMVWVSLLMPVSLLLLSTSTEKAKLSKIFLIVGALLIVVQLVSALVAVICLLVNAGFDSSYRYYNSVFYSVELLISPVISKNLLATPLNFLIQLFDNGYGGFLNFLVAFISAGLTTVAALLLILSNAICTVGFFLAGSKKNAPVEVVEEIEAPVEE